MQGLGRCVYIYSTYVYVQTYRLWKRGGVGKDGMTVIAGEDVRLKRTVTDEEYGGQ